MVLAICNISLLIKVFIKYYTQENCSVDLFNWLFIDTNLKIITSTFLICIKVVL